MRRGAARFSQQKQEEELTLRRSRPGKRRVSLDAGLPILPVIMKRCLLVVCLVLSFCVVENAELWRMKRALRNAEEFNVDELTKDEVQSAIWRMARALRNTEALNEDEPISENQFGPLHQADNSETLRMNNAFENAEALNDEELDSEEINPEAAAANQDEPDILLPQRSYAAANQDEPDILLPQRSYAAANQDEPDILLPPPSYEKLRSSNAFQNAEPLNQEDHSSEEINSARLAVDINNPDKEIPPLTYDAGTLRQEYVSHYFI